MTASPCRNICQLDTSGTICLGCLRTIDEIAGWAVMTECERQRVLRRVDERVRHGPDRSVQ